jgi:hypothetical protein
MSAAAAAAPANPAAAPANPAAAMATVTSAQFQTQINTLNAELGALLETRRILSAADRASITSTLQRYQQLNEQLSRTITSATHQTDTGSITTNIGALQAEIKPLQDELATIKEEAATADARKRSVENVEQNVSFHQLYLIERPLRKLSIPTLFTLSVVFLMGGIFFLYKLNVVPKQANAITRLSNLGGPTSGFLDRIGLGFSTSALGPGMQTQTQAQIQAQAPSILGNIFKNIPLNGRGLSTYWKA